MNGKRFIERERSRYGSYLAEPSSQTQKAGRYNVYNIYIYRYIYFFFGNFGHAKLTNNQTYKTVVRKMGFVSATH